MEDPLGDSELPYGLLKPNSSDLHGAGGFTAQEAGEKVSKTPPCCLISRGSDTVPTVSFNAAHVCSNLNIHWLELALR
jgi:hypothetical protein